MKFSIIATLAVLCATSNFNQVLGAAAPGPEFNELVARQGRPVAFNVAVSGGSCGKGTTISCSPSPGSPCKGNFSPAQGSIVVTRAAGNCHISLYNQANQGGAVAERLNTDTTGTCVTVSPASWLSYGVFCD